MEQYSERTMDAVEYNQQGVVLQGKGLLEEALSMFERAVAADPMYIESYLNIGHVHVAQEAYDKAQLSYNRGLMVDKTDGRLYFHLGNVALFQDDYNKAVEMYRQAVANGLDDAVVHFNMGFACQEQGNTDFALRSYANAIRKNPNIPEYRLKRATLLLDNQMLDAAMDTLEEFIRLFPDIFEGYHYKFETLLQMGMMDAAAKFINDAAALFPEDASLLYDKIRILVLLEQYDKALALITQAQNLPGYEDEKRNLLFEQAKIAGMQNNIEGSLRQMEECLSFEKPGEPDLEIRYYLLTMYSSLRRYDALLRCAEAMLSADSGDPFILPAFYYKPFALEQLGRKEEARVFYKEGIRVLRAVTIHDATDLEAYAFRAMCHNGLGEHEKALDILNYLTKTGADTAELHALKGIVYAAMGDRENEANEKMQYERMGGAAVR